MNKKTKRVLYTLIKQDGLIALAAGIIFFVVCLRMILFGETKFEIIDWTIFFSIIATVLLEWFTGAIKRFILNKLEDDVKLEPDYNKVLLRYCKEDFVKYNNENIPFENKKILKKIKKDFEQVCFPVICEQYLEGINVEISDSLNMYELPEIIKEHFEEIFAAHATSKVYNQLNIRIEKWEMEKEKTFRINSARTTYFKSLVTNRAMDYKWGSELTVRELCEYGPFLHSFEESVLSNHLGFNGFVESDDNYIIFTKRRKNLSIGKETYGPSVSASVKTKYALDDIGNFTKEGLEKAIIKETKSELKIKEKDICSFSCDKNIIAAYRDLVEGGKPQLLVFIKCRQKKDSIVKNFQEKVKEEDRSTKIADDGHIALCLDRRKLKEVGIVPGFIVYDKKKYKMTPSTTASLVMLINYLEKR